MAETAPNLDAVLEQLAQHDEVVLAYLFGSVARGGRPVPCHRRGPRRGGPRSVGHRPDTLAELFVVLADRGVIARQVGQA